MWPPTEPDAATHRAWIRQGWERLRRFGTGGNYINFQTADEGGDRIRATYDPNYERLARIKETYDPDNQFRMNRSIWPE